MRSKIKVIGVFIILFLLIFSQYCFAKYVIVENKKLDVYIDKTPPVINLKAENRDENYSKTDLDKVINESKQITISTSDNIKIAYNEYVYNPNAKDFNNLENVKFDSGTVFENDGYYKVSAVDTSGNKTEIIFMIDKTSPDVQVKYFKKGEVKTTGKTEVIKVAGIKEYKASENVINLEENNLQTETVEQQSGVALMSARSTSYVYNETDFRNALSARVGTIITYGSINFYSPIYINYEVTVTCATNENALRYGGTGSFIVIQNGGTLNLEAMVVDGRGMAGSNGIYCINVQSGGKLRMKSSSIIDGGLSNTGLLLNSGSSASFYSAHVAYSGVGIRVKGNASLVFYNLSDGRSSEFWNNTTAISFEGFSGTTNFNQSNIKIYNNTHGIIVESSSGKVNMSAGVINNNSSNGIFSKAGTFNLSGGSIHSNGNGINFGAGALNITGGNIYSNKVGVLLNSSYSGKMTMTGGKIYSNSSYAINHGQKADGSCTITGGTVTGAIYLAQTDNYVNTNSSYPTFTVTPSSYYFKRKLVRTTSNAYANNEISKVTMTPSGSWYKYVEDEYIKVWRGCNVIVKYKDYYGNVLSTETITGNLGENYETTPKELDGYDLIVTPSNSKGVYTENDITVEYKYDLKNVAQVTYEDLLSGVQTAKYWYNESSETFSGEGTDFENNKIFENYGYYKVEVINNVGLKKELIFSLNKDSLTR